MSDCCSRMAATVCCLSFSNSSAGNEGSRSISASVAARMGKSSASARALICTAKASVSNSTSAPTLSSAPASSSLPRLSVPRFSISAVMRASPGFSFGSKCVPARRLPRTATVGVAAFSSTSSTAPVSRSSRTTREAKPALPDFIRGRRPIGIPFIMRLVVKLVAMRLDGAPRRRRDRHSPLAAPPPSPPFASTDFGMKWPTVRVSSREVTVGRAPHVLGGDARDAAA